MECLSSPCNKDCTISKSLGYLETNTSTCLNWASTQIMGSWGRARVRGAKGRILVFRFSSFAVLTMIQVLNSC